MFIIRDAKVSDLERLTEIYNWAIRYTTASFDVNEQTLEQRKEWLSHYGAKHPLIVHEMDGMVTGYCSLSKFREKEGYSKTVEVSVYVHPKYQRMGIGTVLMKTILERAGRLGHHVVMAGITAGNDVSVKMHEELGFKLCGEFKEVGYKFGKWQDCLFYQLIL